MIWSEFVSANNLQDFPELETPCNYCRGRGGEYIEGRGDWHQCGMCNGAGTVPTELGERILSLMRNNFRPMLAHATNGA